MSTVDWGVVGLWLGAVKGVLEHGNVLERIETIDPFENKIRALVAIFPDAEKVTVHFWKKTSETLTEKPFLSQALAVMGWVGGGGKDLYGQF